MKKIQFDLGRKSAGTKSATELPPGDLVLFEHSFGNQDGWEFRTSLDCTFMGEYNDSASSMIVYSGTWTFYEHSGYNQNGTQAGWAVTLGPGCYNFVGDLQGMNGLSSFHQIA